MSPDAAAQLSPQRKPYRVRVAADMSMKPMDADELRDITVRSSSGAPVPLGLLGKPMYVTEPGVLRTEGSELVGYVYIDLNSGVDVESYTKEGEASLRTAEASGRGALSSRASGSSGAGNRSSWPQENGGCSGSRRSSSSSCSGCSTGSSAA